VSDKVHVSVPMTVTGPAGSAYTDPEFQRYLQDMIQEATLRYGQLNPSNGIPKEPNVSTEARFEIVWETVAVTALPLGWRNAFEVKTPDGSIKVIRPCPAILLQEKRSVIVLKGGTDFDGVFHHEGDVEPAEPPYETRTVFAQSYDGGPTLGPVDDGDGYICTIGPGED
jgi:hypothetical protein